MRILLVSTYELGHQPLNLASAAGALSAAGHEVRTADLAVERWTKDDIRWADALACSVPMHTAMRLARDALAAARVEHPGLPACAFGLYAVVEGQGFDRLIAGEFQEGLVDWVDWLAAGSDGDVPVASVSIGRNRQAAAPPVRDSLPPLDRYARLSVGGAESLVGYVEASRGCAHRCTHCPVPVVYDGRTRLVDPDEVLSSVARLVAAGARHITFGDPDFLNAPSHAMSIVDRLHERWPDLTFDATIKVEHLLRHCELLPRLAAGGCLFVVTAVESLNDDLLRRLDKGHRGADAATAVRLLRASGIEPRPTWLPFTPWTSLDDVDAIVEFVAAHDLIGNVDPVQYSIRLLVPPGSLMLSQPDLVSRLGPYDADHLTWIWASDDPRVDLLQSRLASIAARAGTEGSTSLDAFRAVRTEVDEALGRPTGELVGVGSTEGRPRLTEPWFC